MAAMGPLFSHLSEDNAHTYALVLTAAGIPSSIRQHDTRWTVYVAATHRQAAIRAVALYLRENPPPPPEQRPALPPLNSLSAVTVVTVLALLHTIIQPGYEHTVFVDVLGADAAKIVGGQVYRCVTALLLHADWGHLVGNIVALALFGTVAAAFYGWGLGWLIILLGGATGNWATAFWYQSHHVAIGASTAAFAAVGMCTVLRLGIRTTGMRRSWRRYLPLAGGLALLGFLGTAPRSDLVAHLTGFGFGLVFGWGGLRLNVRSNQTIQAAAAIATTGIAAAAWVWGLAYSG